MDNNTSLTATQHDGFMEWVKKQGVQINGVVPAQISGRGLGIIANRRIEAGEELVSVPTSALLSVNSIPADFRLTHREISAHGLLASFLAFGGKNQLSRYRLWRETWPSPRDFDAFPLCWPRSLRNCKYNNGGPQNGAPNGTVWTLPPAIGGHCGSRQEGWHTGSSSGLLQQQEMKLQKDWAIVSRIFPGKTLEAYTYSWLLVNTRTLYCDGLGGNQSKSREDRIVLCPFVDLFNHNDHGCTVFFDKGYRVISDRMYELGDEIYVSYGSHNNDFLMVEYGFILDENRWDSLPIDALVLHDRIDESARTRLKDAGYFGLAMIPSREDIYEIKLTQLTSNELDYHREYTLSSEGVCHRTHVAIRTQTLDIPDWKKWVACKNKPNRAQEMKAEQYIVRHILDVYYAEARGSLDFLRKNTTATNDLIPGPVRTLLIRRCTQIRDLIRDAFKSSPCDPLTGHGWSYWSEELDEAEKKLCS